VYDFSGDWGVEEAGEPGKQGSMKSDKQESLTLTGGAEGQWRILIFI
jgi:hypothetical protein